MNVAADRDGRLGFVDVALLEQQLLDLVAERPNRPLLQVLAALELCYPLVDLSHLNCNNKQ